MKIKKYIYAMVGAVLVLLGLSACSPNEYDLGDKDVTSADLVEGTAYSITHDDDNPNIIYLKSLMADRYQVCWVHPQGRSQEKEIELHIPFPGTYDVLFGVETRGGVVYGDTAHFTVSDFCADFVDNELYTMLTGGVGKSKTWIPDTGDYGLASGDMSYGDPSVTDAEWNNFTSNWDPSGNVQDASGNFSNSTMTFDLINGANINTTTVSSDGTSTSAKGTYLIDADNHRLNLTDCKLLHSPKVDNITDEVGWKSDIHIVTLTDNQLRLAVLRNKETSGEDKWWIVFNFVSKDYADSYEAPEDNASPTLEDGWRDFVEPKNDKIITYQLSGFNWYNKDGSSKAVTAVSANSNNDDLTIALNSNSNTYEFTSPSGSTQSGSYTLSDDGIYTFSPSLPTVNLSADGRAKFKCNSDGTLRILGFSESANCDGQTGGLSSIAWGSKEYDDQGNFYQYMGYGFDVVRAGTKKTYPAILHLFNTSWSTQESDPIYVVAGTDADYTLTIKGSCSTTYGVYLDVDKILKDYPDCDIVIKDIKVDGKEVSFDDSSIERCSGDGTNAARRYLVNPWGATASNASKYVFSSSLTVKISVKMDNGTSFITE